MDVYQLLILQFIAHFIADFMFQSPQGYESKNNNFIRNRIKID